MVLNIWGPLGKRRREWLFYFLHTHLQLLRVRGGAFVLGRHQTPEVSVILLAVKITNIFKFAGGQEVFQL